MRWYLTATHISHCEIKSVTANYYAALCKYYKNGLCNITDWSNKFTLSVFCNKQVSCFKYFKALQLAIMAHNHSLIARYTRI